MPDQQQQPPTSTSHRFLPWWLPGVVLGTLAAAGAFFVVQARRATESTHKAEAVIESAPAEPEEKRRHHAFLLRSRDLITRTLAEPAVAALPSVRDSADPVADVEARLAVAETGPGLLVVTLTGNDADDMKVLLDHIVKRYVDEATAFHRRDRDDQRKKLEQLADAVRGEIDAMEKQIELIGRANGTTGGADNETRLVLLQRRHSEADAEYNRVNRDLVRLEAELAVLKKQAAQKNDAPPDPAREARLAQLGTEIEIKKEEREKLRAERDAFQKLIANGVGSGLNIDAMRQALAPQREQLQKVNGRLAGLRVGGLDSPVRMCGAVTVVPTRPRDERAVTVGVPLAVAFAGGFALATGLSFVGLMFRVLRRAAVGQ